ncbi:mevalonate kinase-like isoform X2 [Olea europaea var. sylvestris]|uniref:Mevalonate kinase n=1 Tax=Olea europaea subsp. europaea TaxID=158383 RepID=A0A8S0T406_OLEEU|nr:mevalonate kinase-like isoform X1 [Olea europaea var. sylvestris]XP_022866131.1 mevalonate kinase-like isoform X2 [Olea europaea var. sylvestris]CAA3000092.1 mevalonate kinase [Olea europaea subsp. europaea]
MEVRARAPGKIILVGEHAVVHGSTAVAAAIDLYTYVTLGFPTPSDNDDTLKLNLKDVDLEFCWPVGRIKEVLPDLGSHTTSSPSSCSLETIKAIASLVEEQNIPEAKIGLASGVSTFLWLYTSIHGYKPAKAVVNSELPLGSGLGSSAAFCVALSAALLALSDSVTLDFSHQGWQMFEDSELELVNKWAFEGEKIIHGKPSGIDNTVSTYGNIIKFKSGELTRIKTNMPLKMLITNTKVWRNTKALVAGVSERTIRHPKAMDSIFSAVDSISSELASIIQSPVTDDLAITEKEEKLEELMEMNQGLLQCMGVSHASIETVLRSTLKYKLSSKLTGAGGGGCVLTLLPNLLSGTVVDKVIAELESCGFQCYIAGIGGRGMEISFSGSS